MYGVFKGAELLKKFDVRIAAIGHLSYLQRLDRFGKYRIEKIA